MQVWVDAAQKSGWHLRVGQRVSSDECKANKRKQMFGLDWIGWFGRGGWVQDKVHPGHEAASFVDKLAVGFLRLFALSP